jgi:hypothetical protein
MREGFIMRAMENPLYLRHCEIARQISAEARDPQSPYHGKFVGLANGNVVTTGASLKEVVAKLKQIEPNRLNTFSFHVNWDENKVVEIWEVG